jgi:transposase
VFLSLDGSGQDSFTCWRQECLCPTLRPNDIVIADNVRSHKVAGVKDAVEAVGAHFRYLLPYSPNLNPIEQLFTKLSRPAIYQNGKTFKVPFVTTQAEG